MALALGGRAWRLAEASFASRRLGSALGGRTSAWPPDGWSAVRSGVGPRCYVRAASTVARRARLATAAISATCTRTLACPKKRAKRAPSRTMRAICRSTMRRFLRSSR